jgi:hypothetical protein
VTGTPTTAPSLDPAPSRPHLSTNPRPLRDKRAHTHKHTLSLPLSNSMFLWRRSGTRMLLRRCGPRRCYCDVAAPEFSGARCDRGCGAQGMQLGGVALTQFFQAVSHSCQRAPAFHQVAQRDEIPRKRVPFRHIPNVSFRMCWSTGARKPGSADARVL